VVDEQRMRPSHRMKSVLMRFLQYFDPVGWETGIVRKNTRLMKTTHATYSHMFFSGTSEGKNQGEMH